ncbi:MAG: ammonium transporter [Omnitrophica WOR_2 bacterium GWF2_38_59]|nr:MAG: ammonium transporter [Omnitrophica WOR_2 bacterium GWF2_38_59]OGX50295.1 MAG: ammonium transporter [Omnitrophica WOR_2 bacterium RIFOXYA2_FULL_38_17]OGX54067.1 MAG: ammonium transporter [Omnitrophica WOR_2 bacterium RIFOXYA12_FULL_38_10]OGX56747.1 MAG: ammonium transporter [Omnitrophica WOR_2 bacterium RIFOXYB2_FULL_38_16]OGX57290.1 MAG: ammonium transporter [Omnitrophica WOR_2 bacterium RIFOXYC2_FULL_38_12]
MSLSSTASAATADEAMFTVNNTWMLVATILVFIMHLGFATLESGLTRSKNTVNIIFKNVLIVAIGLLTYAIAGFNLMYPGDAWILGKFFGFGGFGISSPEGAAGLIDYANGAYTYWTDFIFQAMFAATAATIVSGAVAERIKLHSFLLFSVIFVGIVYPFVGSWKWGGGWLDAMNFYDFAGSTLVHSVGGWGALAGVIVLGPRIGKYTNGAVKAIPGHSLPLAAIGVFLLWFGWFGFNGGSVLSADPGAVSLVFVTTSLAAAAGIITSMVTSEIIQKKPDLSMVLNGALAGLVGITAGADTVSVLSAIIIGGIAGFLVVVAVIIFDSKLKLDDPVGALSVHLVCGVWGTLAVGIFSINPEHSFITQLIGVMAYAAICFPAAFLIFSIIKITMGIRVTEEQENRGLDICEHGMESYGGFQVFTNQ